MIGVWVLCVASQASPISVVSKIENDKATVEVSLRDDFEGVRKKVGEDLASLLSGTPFVRQATKLSSSIVESPLSVGSNNRKVEAKETLFVKGTNPRILPETLFKMDRTDTVCVTSDCSAKTEVKITGPDANYRAFVDFARHTKVPNGSFELTFAAVPVMASTLGIKSKVTISLKIVDRTYQAYMQSLKLGKSTPTELQLQKGFLLWAHALIRRLGGA